MELADKLHYITMNKKIIKRLLALIIIQITIIASYGAYNRIDSVRKELAEYRSYTQEKEQEQAIGGLESDIVDLTFSSPYGFKFPIHPEDYVFISSEFGSRISPTLHVEKKHNGVDICAVRRAQVISIQDGVVLDHYPAPGTPYPGGGRFKGHPVYGGLVVIQHTDGSESSYAHLSWTNVKIGQRIKAGQIIGRIGSTGVSTGPHLHLELRINHTLVNPLLYIPIPK